MQRCVDHGIVKYLVEKNKRQLSGVRPKEQKIAPAEVKAISVADLKNQFFLFALGIVLSTVTFLVEKIYVKFRAEILV